LKKGENELAVGLRSDITSLQEDKKTLLAERRELTQKLAAPAPGSPLDCFFVFARYPHGAIWSGWGRILCGFVVGDSNSQIQTDISLATLLDTPPAIQEIVSLESLTHASSSSSPFGRPVNPQFENEVINHGHVLHHEVINHGHGVINHKHEVINHGPEVINHVVEWCDFRHFVSSSSLVSKYAQRQQRLPISAPAPDISR
jgi:hypothetical protein